MLGKILSIGHNFTQLRARNAAIQKAGYEVVTTKETEMVLELSRKQSFDAIVVCNSIPVHLRESIARDLRRLNRALCLIVLCNDGEHERFVNLADELIIDPQKYSQEPLIHAIERVLARHKQKKTA